MPRGGYLMRGITRANIVRLCQQEGLPLRECDFYLTQVRNWREDIIAVQVSCFVSRALLLHGFAICTQPSSMPQNASRDVQTRQHSVQLW